MLCAAIDIGSNTTRVLVAEPDDGQLRKVMEQRAYTRIVKAREEEGRLDLRRQGRRGGRRRRHAGPPRGGARRRGDPDRRDGGGPRGRQLRGGRRRDRRRRPGFPVEVLSEHEEGRLAFIGATKGARPSGRGRDRRRRRRRRLLRGHPRDDRRAASARSTPSRSGRARSPRSCIKGDPPGPAEIRKLRDRIEDFFDGRRDRPARPGGRGRRQRDLAAPARRRGARVRDARARDPRADQRPGRRRSPRKFELDARRVEVLPSGVLLLEALSQLLGQPLQIGKGGLREGVILDLLATTRA